MIKVKNSKMKCFHLRYGYGVPACVCNSYTTVAMIY